MSPMTSEEIKQGLGGLRPDMPWAHHFDLGFGIETVSPEIGHFYRKAIGLKVLGELLPGILRAYMGRRSLNGMRCLDVGSAEGAHSITMAENDAREVTGLEGRQLYVDRANFVAKVKGLRNVRFQRADVRKLDTAALGKFDFVLCSGLLHHLNKEAFLDFTRDLHALTGDTLMLYTHVSSEYVVAKFGLTPTKPVNGTYAGALFREHKENATPQQRLDKVRASLDSEHSFWPTEDALIQRFVDVGFKSIIKLYEPVFQLTYIERVFRAIWILRQRAP